MIQLEHIQFEFDSVIHAMNMILPLYRSFSFYPSEVYVCFAENEIDQFHFKSKSTEKPKHRGKNWFQLKLRIKWLNRCGDESAQLERKKTWTIWYETI